MRVVVRAVAALILAGGLLSAIPSIVVATTTTRTTSYVTMTSEPGDPVGQGHDWLWGAPDSITVSRSADGWVTVEANSASQRNGFSFAFAPSAGGAIDVGEYDDAVRPGTESGSPGIDVSGDGRGCLNPSGHFRVLDFASDLSHLWITFEQHCSISFTSNAPLDPALFGEVKVGMPKGDPGVDVRAESVTWPAEYPGVESTTFPVPIANTGSAAITVSDAAVLGDTSAFSVAGSTCAGVIQPGESCQLSVGFSPQIDSTHRASLAFTAGGHSRRVYLEGNGIGGTTAWTMDSDPGEMVGGGQSFAFNPANARFEAAGDATELQFYLRDLAENYVTWSAQFRPESGQVLQVGHTYPAVGYPGLENKAGMRVSSDSEYCLTVDGSFTVDDLVIRRGEVASAAISFEQHCEGETTALRGTISYRAGADLSRRPSAVSIAASPSLVTFPNATRIAGHLGSVGDSSPLAQEPVLIYGRAAATNNWRYIERVTSDALGNFTAILRPGSNTDYRVQYFGRSDQYPARPSTIRVRLRARVRLVVNDTSILAGTWVRLRTTVGPNESGRRVAVERYRHGEWAFFEVGKLDADSVARFRLHLTRPGQYTLRVRKPADQVTVASTSRTVRIVVR